MCQPFLIGTCVEQAAVSSPETEGGGLLLPLQAMDWAILAFWDWVAGMFVAVSAIIITTGVML